MSDLTILGAGIFGLSIAWRAVQAGARVQVIDPGGPGAGASGGLVGALAPHAPEAWTAAKALQLQALLQAPDWWAGVEAASGLPSGYARIGRVQPLADDRAIARARDRARAATDLWAGQARWFLRTADAPGDPVSPTGLLAEDTLSARITPRLALAALVAAIRAKGGQVLTSGEMRGPVIHATGAAGLRDLSADLARPVGRGEKGQAMVLRRDLGTAPQIYAPGLHIVPHPGETVAIGSTAERDYDRPDSTDDRLDDLLERACALLPLLSGAPVVTRWAGERPRSASRQVILGPWPGRPGHFIANGGFKTGFAMAPLAAGLITDLVLSGKDHIPPGLRFDPD